MRETPRRRKLHLFLSVLALIGLLLLASIILEWLGIPLLVLLEDMIGGVDP